MIRENFLSVLYKNLCCDPSSEPSRRDADTVQMRGHNIWFQREIRKIIPQLSSNTPLI